MSFIGPASLSLFKSDIWACVLGLRAYCFKPNQFYFHLISLFDLYTYLLVFYNNLFGEFLVSYNIFLLF